jgi:chromosome segregation ATPase
MLERMSAMDERAVEELRGLAALDTELTERASALRGSDALVAALRARAEQIDVLLTTYPEEEVRRDEELNDAHEELDRRREELAAARQTLAEARDDDARVHAEHAVARAVDHIAVAEERISRAQSSHDELQRDAAALPGEIVELEDRAGTVRDVPPFDGSLIDWAARAHAELFVAAGQIDVQRERVIREANELASMLLGEQIYGATVAQALARVEGFSAAETRKQ